MPTIRMVRHGRAAAGYDSHRDPGLDALGREQAVATANTLAAAMATPAAICASPLARARETAAPLAARWDVEVAIEPRIAEIPAPMAGLRERAAWLRGVMAGGWAELPEDLLGWRQALIDCVLAFPTDTVAFCHFVAINVIVGAATGVEPLVVFRPDNGSVTTLCTDGGRLGLVELGREASTTVN